MEGKSGSDTKEWKKVQYPDVSFSPLSDFFLLENPKKSFHRSLKPNLFWNFYYPSVSIYYIIKRDRIVQFPYWDQIFYSFIQPDPKKYY